LQEEEEFSTRFSLHYLDISIPTTFQQISCLKTPGDNEWRLYLSLAAAYGFVSVASLTLLLSEATWKLAMIDLT
jgi:hypothetical protein